MRIALGRIHADAVTFAEAIERIMALAGAGQGGYVVTPNVDHVVLAESRPDLVTAYEHSALSLVDGTPLLWLARWCKRPLPEKVSGSDLVRPLLVRAAAEGLSVYLLGGKPGVGERAALRLSSEIPGLRLAGFDAPPLGFERDDTEVVARVQRARPDLVLVALGCPKQELWMHKHQAALRPAVALGVGGSLDFIAGTARRAPLWMSRAGLEWLFRLAHDPRRLAARYLVRDRAILGIAWRMWRPPLPLAGEAEARAARPGEGPTAEQ